MKKRLVTLLLAIGLILLGTDVARGQATASATIVGTVTDPSGAVVGANVTAANKGTGATRTTSSAHRVTSGSNR